MSFVRKTFEILWKTAKFLLKTAKILLLLSCILLAAALTVYVFLPWGLNRWGVPELEKRFQISGRVRSAGLFGADLSDLRGSFGRIGSLKADWRWKLVDRYTPVPVVKTVELDDFDLFLSRRDGVWRCDTVFAFGPAGAQKDAGKNFDLRSFRSPVDFETVIFRNARINLDLEGETYVFPAEFAVTRRRTPEGGEEYDLAGSTVLEGRVQKIACQVSLEKGEADFNIDALARGISAKIGGKLRLTGNGTEQIAVEGKGDCSGAGAGGFAGKTEFKLDYSLISGDGRLSLIGSGSAAGGDAAADFTLDAGREAGKVSFSARAEPRFGGKFKGWSVPGGVSLSGRVAEGKTSYLLHAEKIACGAYHVSPVVVNGIGGAFSGSLKVPDVPGLAVAFSGNILSLDQIDFEASVRDFQTQKPFRFGDFSASGKISAGLSGTCRNGRVSASLKTRLRDGTVENEADRIRAENISLHLEFPSLPELRTPPDQRLAVKKLSFGEHVFTDLSLHFQVHSPELFTLSGGDCVWNGGLLSLPSITYRAGQTGFKSHFICENLPMGKTLDALGLKNVSSGGELFGKIPFTVNENGIFFHEARLYTMPGEKHTLKLGDGGQLSGMVENVANLDLAIEALKDFEYSLAKVNLRTDGEILRVELSLDGRPLRELPFVWDEKSGTLLRSGSGGKVRLQGLKLDLILNIPLNRMLKINQAIRKMKEGSKK